MRAARFLLPVLLLAAVPAWGQAPGFPYEATVQADKVSVRSGPGQRYYATGRLNVGDHVTVQRHDPGGWYMIAPPPGSFSWIDAALVAKSGPDQGVVQAPPLGSGQQARAIVRIGSELSDDHGVYSRELSNGETVRILGQQELQTERGPVLMYKIAPPSAEYRWVKGDYIVPVSEAVRAQQDRDPFTVPTSQRRPPAGPPPGPAIQSDPFGGAGGASGGVLERELIRAEQSGAARRSGPVGEVSDALRTRLNDVDDCYADMMAGNPQTWRLDEIAREYRALQADAGGSLDYEIETRLAALETRQRMLADYQDFVRLTTETSQRDAQLLSMQGGVPVPFPTSAPGAVQLGQPEPVSDSPQEAAPRLTTIEPIPDQPMPSTSNGPVTPKLSGAGIIQRVQQPFPGFPKHVLLHPDGHILAYLESVSGINLDQYLGQPMGLIGERAYDPQLRGDRLVVRQLMPVRLKP
jgi:hypothetical protein